MLYNIATLDGGNTKIKGWMSYGRKIKAEIQFDHIFVKLSRQAYDSVMKREAVNGEDLFIVNGQHYMVGSKALRHGNFELQYGELRYTPEYYGVLSAIAMAKAFSSDVRNIFWMGSHPPKDIDYTDDLMESVVKTWEVHHAGTTRHYEVVDATTFDEPVGGWANVVLRQDGAGFLNKKILEGITLVIDVGGFTTDGIVIDPNGEIDYTTADSIELGVLASVEAFKKDFRADHKDELKGVTFDDAKVHQAIRTGMFDLRGLGKRDCAELASGLRRELAQRVYNFYARYGGAAQFDTVLLTGGGSALIENELKTLIKHGNIIMAEKSADMHMANVRGGYRWCNFHMKIGTFEA